MFVDKTSHSLAPSEVIGSCYAGIFYPGGGGQFNDVVNDAGTAGIAARIYESGGVVGSAGHGAVSLRDIKLSDDTWFVSGKRITCFPRYASPSWVPIDWESELGRRGAVVLLPRTPVEKDKGVQLLDERNRIVSGSFAENAGWVAEQMATLIHP